MWMMVAEIVDGGRIHWMLRETLHSISRATLMCDCVMDCSHPWLVDDAPQCGLSKPVRKFVGSSNRGGSYSLVISPGIQPSLADTEDIL